MEREKSLMNESQGIIAASEDVALKMFLNARGFYLAARVNAAWGNLCDATRKLNLDSTPTWAENERDFRFDLPSQVRLPCEIH